MSRTVTEKNWTGNLRSVSLDGAGFEIKSGTKHVVFSWDQTLDAGSTPATSIKRKFADFRRGPKIVKSSDFRPFLYPLPFLVVRASLGASAFS